jgi:ribosomal protein S18 acetylase RimI-like enzyme
VSKALLRPFDRSLNDAQKILDVDRATFNDCPYPPEKIGRLLTAGEQRAWVADVDGDVVGFVTAFPTRTLQIDGWEVDLLAVHPKHQRQGIGTALIKQAVEGAAGSGTTRTRAAVAVKNHASRRAFESAGFEPLPGSFSLMLCTVTNAAARQPLPDRKAIRPLNGKADAQGVLRLAPSLPRTTEEVTRLASAGGIRLFVAGRDGHVSAFVELVKVQTLLYAGAWVEMLLTSHPNEASLLIAAAVEWVRANGLDEIGCLVAAWDWRLHQAFVSEGFVSAGKYLIMTRTL